jgi:hypothetical protein
MNLLGEAMSTNLIEMNVGPVFAIADDEPVVDVRVEVHRPTVDHALWQNRPIKSDAGQVRVSPELVETCYIVFRFRSARLADKKIKYSGAFGSSQFCSQLKSIFQSEFLFVIFFV